MAFTDKTLVCKECGEEFLFSASEQEFYAEKGFMNEPARCPHCRAIRKQQRNAGREMFSVVCAECGQEAQVPFKPVNDRPVYCRYCFNRHQAQA